MLAIVHTGESIQSFPCSLESQKQERLSSDKMGNSSVMNEGKVHWIGSEEKKINALIMEAANRAVTYKWLKSMGRERCKIDS